MDKTSLGDRMKTYEKAYSSRCMPLLPVIARLDGRAFHTWTKGLNRPFDKDFKFIMKNTTKKLVEQTESLVGYTQSDEITLVFYSDNISSQIFFDGKIQKMNSVLASMCTAYFTQALNVRSLDIKLCGEKTKSEFLLNKPPAIFDCRIFQVPTLEEAANCILWRELDAKRNSILNVAQSKFSHKEMQGKNTKELQEMMFQKDKTNWSKDYTDEDKRGIYFRKEIKEIKFTTEELKNLPEKHEARKNSNLKIKRSVINKVIFPPLNKVINKSEILFYGKKPILKID